MQTQIYSIQKKQIDVHPVDTERDRFSKELYDLLVSHGNVNYLMTKPSLDISEKIKIADNKFNGTIYKGLYSNKKRTILIDDKLFFRYLVTDTSILCIWVIAEPVIHQGREQNYLRYTTFRINTQTGDISLPNSDKEETKMLFKKFLQILTFLEFSELETITLKPRTKYGTKKQGKYMNESGEDVTLVDSTWNKIIVSVGDFGVSGHLRLQPCGADRSERKLIYISEYIKKGYVRKPKKEN